MLIFYFQISIRFHCSLCDTELRTHRDENYGLENKNSGVTVRSLFGVRDV